jgi:hypothetical protein
VLDGTANVAVWDGDFEDIVHRIRPAGIGGTGGSLANDFGSLALLQQERQALASGECAPRRQHPYRPRAITLDAGRCRFGGIALHVPRPRNDVEQWERRLIEQIADQQGDRGWGSAAVVTHVEDERIRRSQCLHRRCQRIAMLHRSQEHREVEVSDIACENLDAPETDVGRLVAPIARGPSTRRLDARRPGHGDSQVLVVRHAVQIAGELLRQRFARGRQRITPF